MQCDVSHIIMMSIHFIYGSRIGAGTSGGTAWWPAVAG